MTIKPLSQCKPRSVARRRLINTVVTLSTFVVSALGVYAMGNILYHVITNGLSSINWAFLTEAPKMSPMATGGGLGNAIVGTFAMTLLATLIGVPTGLFAGVYLSEFGKGSTVAETVRFFNNILMGAPSIVIGIFIYTLLVATTKTYSGYAGGIALAIIMLPVMTRTTEDILNMVPDSLRESGLAMGAPRWKVTTGIVFRSAKSGLVTGGLLAIARVSGETAPLLFTALNSPYWPIEFNTNFPFIHNALDGSTANLTVTIYNYAMSPYESWQNMAWGASFLIIIAVLSLNIFARYVAGRGMKKA